jgi:membrane associated rhomboid family serine protease
MGWLVLIVLGAVAVYVMKPDERVRAAQKWLGPARDFIIAAQEENARPDEFRDALRERTRWPLVTWVIAAANVVLFLMRPGSDQDALVHWGGSIATLTTNGEWWRVLTAAFVHAGIIALFADAVGLMQAGMLVERLVGHVAIAIVYLTSAMLPALGDLSAHPLSVSTGAAGGVLGIYGLLLAVLARSVLPSSPLKIPLRVLRRLAPAAGIFMLYALIDGDLLQTSGLLAVATGFVFGIILTKEVSEHTAPLDRLIMTAIASLVIIVALAVPVRGIVDARPELARLIALEERTAGAYQHTLGQFKLGAVKAEAVAQMIERRIAPDVQAEQDRLSTIGRVANEQQPLVDAAGKYLELRRESWRLRATAMHKSSLRMLRDADEKERAALAAFEEIKPSAGGPPQNREQTIEASSVRRP